MVGKRVFLASPGDVSAEREAVRATIVKFNETFAWELGVSFFSRGWEQTSGGIGRPQQKINDEILNDCDYLVLILGERWGSPPQEGDGYESGTEEEFFRSLELLADPHAPMRNLFVAFRGVRPDQARDNQLERVLEFKDQLERSKKILFKVFDSPASLSDHLTANLLRWAAEAGEKQAVSISLPPREALPRVAPMSDPEDLTKLAVAKAEAKLFTQAEELFNMAIADKNPVAMLEYSRFLRRSGRLGSAMDLNRTLIGSLVTSDLSSDVLLRARALANVGIIERKQGRAEDSVRTLEEALRETESVGTEPDLEAYIHDNLALTYGHLGRLDRVAEELRISRTIRERHGQRVAAESLVNEARVQVRLKERRAALELVDEAIRLAYESEPRDLAAVANALDVRRRALYEINDYNGAAEAASECMDLNQQLGNADGIGIAEFGLALALVGAGRYQEAEERARASLDRNLRSGNVTGHASAQWALAQAKKARGETVEALELASGAQQLARAAQNSPLASAIGRWIDAQSSDHEVGD
jgi:tetratricopeptide (TPR) repeat protein